MHASLLNRRYRNQQRWNRSVWFFCRKLGRRADGFELIPSGDGDKYFFDEKNPESTGWETMVQVNINAVI